MTLLYPQHTKDSLNLCIISEYITNILVIVTTWFILYTINNICLRLNNLERDLRNFVYIFRSLKSKKHVQY